MYPYIKLYYGGPIAIDFVAPIPEPIIGSWLVYIKDNQHPLCLCESQEPAFKVIGGNPYLDCIFWPHEVQWFVIRRRILNGMG